MNIAQHQLDTIADGLAENGYAVVDHFLSEDEVCRILQLDDFKNALLHFKKAGIGKSTDKQINESIRGDYIQWIDKETAPPEIKVYLHRLSELIAFVNQALFLSLKDAEVHMTVYPEGTYYKRHLDQFRKDDHRKLSVICYLNEGWQEIHGGQLRMYLPEGEKDVLPVAGRLVCFRSDQIEHEVIAGTRERMSLTGWILDRIA
ncbi:MAG: oxidoreductase [Azospira oryzae]|nr:MAG: oxidoreductase [Azospira oryzae]